MKEYRTTSERWNWEDPEPSPIEPKGEGWYMEGTGATDGRLFWYWCREVVEERKELDDTELQAMICKLVLENLRMMRELEAVRADLKEARDKLTLWECTRSLSPEKEE